MKKKGDAELVAVVLLIMIVIIVITAFAYFYLNYVGESEEKIELKNQVNNADITIKDVALKDTQNLSVTFFSGPGFQMLINYSLEEVNHTYVNITQIINTTVTYEVVSSFVNVSVVSVADVSGSMRPNYGGIPGNKIGELRDATRPFINSILNNTGNQMGLVAYSTGIMEEQSHPLSEDNESLIAIVDSWTFYQWTCICCGIERAITYLDAANEDDYKIMIVMSDGEANYRCNPNAYDEILAPIHAIDAARTAFEDHNITVHAIGFGADADTDTLEAIADAGNGSYYFADLGELEYIYEELTEDLEIPIEVNETVYNQTNVTIYENITTVVYAPKESFYIKIVFYTEDSTYIQNRNLSGLPGPIESKEVDLSLDPEWGIVTDDITKIEIYAAIEAEDGQEIISDEPIAKWEKPSEY
jgi:hypothetical protein